MNITIASLPDREKIVAELWQGNDHFAEINQEGEILMVEVYPRPDGKPWAIPFEELVSALREATTRLGPDSSTTVS